MLTRMNRMKKFKLIQISCNQCINQANLHLQVNIKMKSKFNLKTFKKEINME